MVVIRKGCGWFINLKSTISDIDKELPPYLVKCEVLGIFDKCDKNGLIFDLVSM